jgi:hypothetical protein
MPRRKIRRVGCEDRVNPRPRLNGRGATGEHANARENRGCESSLD